MVETVTQVPPSPFPKQAFALEKNEIVLFS